MPEPSPGLRPTSPAQAGEVTEPSPALGATSPAQAGEVKAPALRWLGRVDYEPTWRAMQRRTDDATDATPDEIWFLEHPPVFTMGMNAKAEHLLAVGDIPVVDIDRGGQVTYHGPGQLVVYPLLDLPRRGLGVRALVVAIEQAIVATLAHWSIEAYGKRDAPGVYVQERKIASVGLRIRRGRSYHGLALNVAMDLEPFARINPCGYAGLQMTQVATLGGPADVRTVGEALAPHLLRELGFERATAIAQSATSTWLQDVSSR
ncbi:MAG TPA: lipoyl(octanoyl) transferase LipB [Steroidobacteraceae bacterium]|nr:lipoyl(octanoyl) transferase LipB [Steroidobacteraceae bacterium]